MLYLIGGAARCGKTTLARKARKQFDGQVISTDAVMVAIRSITSHDTHPDIFDKIVDPVSDDSEIDKKMARLRRRDEIVWSFMKTYLETAPYASDSILSEGCLWPSMFQKLKLEHCAIFVIDTSADHAERLIHIRDTQVHNNWMRDRKYTDESMHIWAQFNIARSWEIVRECKKYGYEYFDIADGGIDEMQSRALEYLLNKGLATA